MTTHPTLPAATPILTEREAIGPYPVEERAFHVVRSSDGVEPEHFRARDRATLSSFPGKDRDDAYAMAESLNRIVRWHVEQALSHRLTTEGGLRREVLAFAHLMEQQLRANDHKPGWKNDTPQALWRRVSQETYELGDEVLGVAQIDPTKAGKEAADVANMAMMVADVCGSLPALASSPPSSEADCPVCHYDCAGANPPMAYCPMRDGPRDGWTGRGRDLASRPLATPSAVLDENGRNAVLEEAAKVEKAAFLNCVRSLFNIDGYLLPELTSEQQTAFIRDPVRYFIGADKAQGDAIWREVSKRQVNA